jgi:hypothetical protein
MICEETLADSLSTGTLDDVAPTDSEHGPVFVEKAEA